MYVCMNVCMNKCVCVCVCRLKGIEGQRYESKFMNVALKLSRKDD